MKLVLTLTSLALVATLGCGGAGGAEESAAASVGILVAPAAALLEPGATATFRATVTGTASTGVKWTADCGSITQAGVYTAPQSKGSCRVTATAVAASVSAQSYVNVGIGGWAARCASEPLRATGTTYYACDCQPGADPDCVSGNDTNPGTSPSAPLKTLSAAAAKFRSMNAGDTVALCRGGKFDGGGTANWNSWKNEACTPGSTCDVRDYDPRPAWGDGNEGRPNIRLAVTGNAGVILLAGPTLVDGLRFLNLRFEHASGGGIGASGTRAFGLGGNVSDLEVCNCEIDGFGIGAHVSLDDCTRPGGYRIRFRGNLILNNSSQGILFDGFDADIDGNYFDNNGHDAANSYTENNATSFFNHTVYISNHRCNARDIRVINNEMRRPQMFQGRCNAATVKSAGGSSGFVFENNLLVGTDAAGSECDGVALDNTYDNETGPANATIRRNRFINHRQAIQVSQSPGTVIEDNVVVQTAPWVADKTFVIGLGHRTGVSSTPFTMHGVVVRNNTIYLNTSGAAALTPIRVYSNAEVGTGIQITGNSVVSVAGESPACYRVDDLSRVSFMDSNHCYGSVNFARVNSTNYSLDSWRAFSGFDGASKTSDPLFVNAPTDLTPGLGSPLVDASSAASTCTVAGVVNQPCSSALAIGAPTWSATEPPKVRDAFPDIGAVER